MGQGLERTSKVVAESIRKRCSPQMILVMAYCDRWLTQKCAQERGMCLTNQ